MSELVDPEIPEDEEPTQLTEAEEAEEAGSSALRSFLGLFIVPLLAVLLCIAIFIDFGWIAYDRQSTRDYLGDLESGWKPRRVQAAYELSKILVSDPRALDKEPGAKAQVRRLFQEATIPRCDGISLSCSADAGLSTRNLKYMRAAAWPERAIVQRGVAQSGYLLPVVVR